MKLSTIVLRGLKPKSYYSNSTYLALLDSDELQSAQNSLIALKIARLGPPIPK